MLQRIRALGFFLLLWGGGVSAQTTTGLSEATSLIFRVTGAEALTLKNFLAERMSSKLDYGSVRYYGNLNSLACSDRNDCFLWLTRKEWREESADRIAFTLPVADSILKGRLALSATDVGLELQDLKGPSAVLSLHATACTIATGSKLPKLVYGACRTELSTAVKKVVPYSASSEFVENSENIVLSFTGDRAKNLFESVPAPAEGNRVQLGPQFYCWDLNGSYACQGKFENLSSSDRFRLQLNRANSMVDTIAVSVDGVPIGICPAYSKVGADLACRIFYDWKAGVDAYPIGNTGQGLAVGWGLVPEARTNE